MWTEKKEVAKDGKSEGVEIREEDVFEMVRSPLFYTGAPVHYQPRTQSRSLNRQIVVKDTVNLWWKKPLFLNAI